MVFEYTALRPQVPATMVGGVAGGLTLSIVNASSVLTGPAFDEQAVMQLADRYSVVLPRFSAATGISAERFLSEVCVPIVRSAVRCGLDASLSKNVSRAESPIAAFYQQGFAGMDMPTLALSGIMSFTVLSDMYERLGSGHIRGIGNEILDGARRLAELGPAIDRACDVPMTHPELRAHVVGRLNGLVMRAARDADDVRGMRELEKFVIVDGPGGYRDVRFADSAFQHIDMVGLDLGESVVGAGLAMFVDPLLMANGNSQGLRTELSGVVVAPEIRKMRDVRISADAGLDTVFSILRQLLSEGIVLRKLAVD